MSTHTLVMQVYDTAVHKIFFLDAWRLTRDTKICTASILSEVINFLSSMEILLNMA